MISQQTINRLVGQDWPDILRTAGLDMSFKLISVPLASGERDTWLAPTEFAPFPHRFISPPVKQQAYFIGQCALREIHKKVTAAAMKDEDLGQIVATAAPAYRKLVDWLQEQGVTPFNRAEKVERALKAYQHSLTEAAMAFLEIDGPERIIRLGNVEPYEPM